MGSRIFVAVGGLAAVVGLASCAACGGQSDAIRTTPTTGAFAPIKPAPPLDPTEQDPDAGTRTGDDLSTVTKPLSGNRYEVVITNVSHVGFINALTWTPPPGLKVDALIGTSITPPDGIAPGACKLSGGIISCKLALRPPTCTCRGDGGTLTLTFAGSWDRRKAASNVGSEGHINVSSVTPVPYIIPSTPLAEPGANADLPICKQNQASTIAHPCIGHG